LATLHAVVEAPVDSVVGLLLNTRPDSRSPLVPAGRVDWVPSANGGYTASLGDAGTVVVNPAARTASVRGRWWYRADITVTPHPAGCLLTQQIFNIAEKMRWGVRFVSRQPLAASPAAFDALLHTIGERLGCRAYPVP
jgi:hypothetical protein